MGLACGLLLLRATPSSSVQGEARPSTPEPVTVVIDVTNTGEPIHPLLYGHFIENLFNWFEGGLWAEMLGDRKFFYPVNNEEALDPPNSRSRFIGRWRPVGPEDQVAMDTEHAYVGEHAPRIMLDGTQPRGLQQAGLVLKQDKPYTGRVVLAGDPGAKVEVSLIWGSDPADRQTVAMPALSSAYQTVPFSVTALADTEKGRLEITGTGSGSFLVGAVSLMPADNIEGFRPDLIALLREMNPTMLRWGGNFSAGYEWRDGIGDRDQRPPRYDYAWGAVEQNDVGTFEILALNRLVGAEPNIGVNAGLGDAHSAAQWVEYVNGSVDTPMGRLRAEHGHPEPFNVTWWGIGNEMYGQWQLGHMSLDHYVIQHNRFAKAMRAVDPSILLVASGATPFETSMTARHHRKPLPSTLPYEYGTPQDWSGGLLEHSSNYFEYLAEHFYPSPRQAFDVEKQELVEVDDPLVDQVRRVPNRVRAAVEAWEEYNRRMPWLKDTGIKMVLDEWSARGSDVFSALAVSETLHEIFRHTDIFAMSAFTCAPCALVYNRTEAGFRGSGLTFKLYANHFGSIPVAVSGPAPQHEVSGTVGVDKPSVTSGSDTYPVDVMAALTENRRTLTVAIVNPTESSQAVALTLRGAELPEGGRMWTITGPDPEARNRPGEEPVVTLVESLRATVSNTLTVAPLSVTLYELEVE